MPIHIGIIGPGLIWQKSHRQAFATFGDRVAITAICARSRRTLDEAGTPGAKEYTEMEGLLKDKTIDAVMVLTPINLNASTAIKALKAGKHVFLEKPASTSIEECRALLDAETASGKRVYVLEQYAYGGYLAALKRALAEKRLGDLVLYDRIEHGMFDADKNDAGGYGKTEWRQKADFPLGPLFDGGIHSIAELTQLFGVPLKVSASGRKWRKGFGSYDEILMCFTYASGLHGIFSHSSAMPSAFCGFTIRGTKALLRPSGDKIQLINTEAQTENIEVDQNPKLGMWDEIITAFENGNKTHYNLTSAAQDVAILDAVGKSLASGKEESVVMMR